MSKLRAALEQLNPALPSDAINSAVDELARDRSAMSLAAANRDLWDLLRDGVTVSIADQDRGGLKTERVRIIGWGNPRANDFLLVSQMTITGKFYTCRPETEKGISPIFDLLNNRDKANLDIFRLRAESFDRIQQPSRSRRSRPGDRRPSTRCISLGMTPSQAPPLDRGPR